MNKKIYKILIILIGGVFLIILVFKVFLPNQNNNDLSYGWGSDIYTGFLNPKQGAWSDIVFIDQGGKENLQRTIFLGEKVIDGVVTYGIEIDSNVSDNTKDILQIWLDKKLDKIVKIVSKLKGKNEVVCVDESLMKLLLPSFETFLPAAFTPRKYGSTNQYAYGTFITETQKTIQIAKFIDENKTEIWISSQVPFGIIKVIDTKSNKIIAYLRDFGLSGAKPKISETEMINCTKKGLFNLPK
ncbi:MAG: hypothetical protein WC306_02880 [Candidatus Paceibacterota bacterium]|jgi:hypothetical protein